MTTQIASNIRTALPIAQSQPMVMNIQNVSKQYSKKNWGLRDFTLEIGPGGAGKSTPDRIAMHLPDTRLDFLPPI